MAAEPVSASSLARAGATAGAVAAAAGIASFSWNSLIATQALASTAVALSAILLHLRHTAAQIFARALWLSTALLATLNVVLGPTREQAASALVVAGSSAAMVLMGRSGLRGLPGAFEPSRYRAPLLFSLTAASAEALGFAFYGVMVLEGWGALTNNVMFAAGLGLGIYGLVRMRTWGVLVLAAMHLLIAGTALLGDMHLPLLLREIYGLTSLAALAGLAPILLLAAKRLRNRDVAPSTQARFASVPAHNSARIAMAPQNELEMDPAPELDAGANSPTRKA